MLTIPLISDEPVNISEKRLVAAGKAANLGGERPLPSIARFGRLAYPMRGEVTNRAVLGRKRHGRLWYPIRMLAGGNDLGGSKLGGLKINK
jgi:hypothetical protein